MPATRARFPRASYARRAAMLADDLAEWHASLLEYARGPDNWMHADTQVTHAESRALALEDIVQDLHDISMRISAIR